MAQFALASKQAQQAKLALRIATLEAALGFYAMPEHIWVRSAALAADKGYIARKALGQEK